jgi:serine phosphatase RsbU (regulator of sigma subunit)
MSSDGGQIPGGAWPQARDYRKSIRLEFALFVGGLFLVLMAASGYLITRQYVTTVTQSVVEKLVVQARAFSGPAGKHILAADGPDELLLNNICQKLATDNPDIYWAGITGSDQTYLAHTDLKQVMRGTQLTVLASPSADEFLRPHETFALRGDTVYITTPIIENNLLIGRLGLAASARQIHDARRTSMITVATVTALIIILGIPLSMFILHRKLRPITVIAENLRQTDLDHLRLDIPVKSRNELGYLAETLRVMGARLNRAQRELVEKERLERELEIAREVQASILPRAYPSSARFEFAGAYRSAREVGGDYYDFIDFDERRLGVLIADVAGKSLPGMLVMLMTRDIVKTIARFHTDPARLLSAVNRELLPNIRQDMFVTMCFGLLDKETGRFRFASAGHNPLVWLKNDGQSYDLIRPRGYPLGMMSAALFDQRIETQEISLGARDWLVQYTDGVNEAQNLAQEEYGMDRMVTVLQNLGTREPADLVAAMLHEHDAFVGEAPQYDDITLLAMKWKGASVDTSTIARPDISHAGTN